MKLVKEHIIFEKFTEEGDPIKDLGIGITVQFDKWLKKRSYTWSESYKKRHKNLNEIIFINLMRSDTPYKYEFMELMLKQGVSPNAEHSGYSTTGGFLQTAVDTNDKKAVKLLLKYGADPNIVKHFLFLLSGSQEMKDFIIKACKEYNNKHVNEKFTEEGDPIHDMGIGTITIRSCPHLNTKNGKFYDEYEFSQHNALEFEEYLKDHYITYKVIHDSTPVNWPVVLLTGTRSSLIKMIEETDPFEYCVNSIKNGDETMEEILQIVHVNEKFTEDSDPVHDMNIGIGEPIDFGKIAKKTIRRGGMNGREKWLNFLKSLIGKKLTGRFENFNRDIITIRIKNYHSYMNGYDISFDDYKDRNYEIDFDETYYVL